MRNFIFSKAAGLQPATLLKNEPHVLHVFSKNFSSLEHLPLAAPKKYEKQLNKHILFFIWLYHVVFYALKIL